MAKVAAVIKKELLELLPPTVFFFFAFHLLFVSKALMLEQYKIPIGSMVMASIGALIAGKVVLLTNLLPFVNRYGDKPLIYNVVWKTMLYLLAVLTFHIAEGVIRNLIDGGALGDALRHTIAEFDASHALLVVIWLGVLFLMYNSVAELSRRYGRETVLQVFLGIGGGKGQE